MKAEIGIASAGRRGLRNDSGGYGCFAVLRKAIGKVTITGSDGSQHSLGWE